MRTLVARALADSPTLGQRLKVVLDCWLFAFGDFKHRNERAGSGLDFSTALAPQAEVILPSCVRKLADCAYSAP